MEHGIENTNEKIYYHAPKSFTTRYIGVAITVLFCVPILIAALENGLILFFMALAFCAFAGWCCYKLLTASRTGLKITDKGISWPDFWGDIMYVGWEEIEKCEYYRESDAEFNDSLIIKTTYSKKISVDIKYNCSERELSIAINKAYCDFKNKQAAAAAESEQPAEQPATADFNNNQASAAAAEDGQRPAAAETAPADESKFEQGLIDYKKEQPNVVLTIIGIIILIIMLFCR